MSNEALLRCVVRGGRCRRPLKGPSVCAPKIPGPTRTAPEMETKEYSRLPWGLALSLERGLPSDRSTP